MNKDNVNIKENAFVFLFKVLMIILISYILSLIYKEIKENYQVESDDKMLMKVKDNLRKVKPEKVNELKFFEGDKSYTINKKNVYICLKDENDKYYDENMLTYVALHELAHSLCDEIGHTEKFHKIFQKLLKEAAEKGVYDPAKKLTEKYCGHD